MPDLADTVIPDSLAYNVGNALQFIVLGHELETALRRSV